MTAQVQRVVPVQWLFALARVDLDSLCRADLNRRVPRVRQKVGNRMASGDAIESAEAAPDGKFDPAALRSVLRGAIALGDWAPVSQTGIVLRAAWAPGVSVVIPECGTPELLERALDHLRGASAGLTEPWEDRAQLRVVLGGVKSDANGVVLSKYSEDNVVEPLILQAHLETLELKVPTVGTLRFRHACREPTALPVLASPATAYTTAARFANTT